MTPTPADTDSDDARTAEQPTEDDAAPDVLVTMYQLTVREDFSASVTMELDGPDGEVTINAELDARDTRRRITREVTVSGPALATTLTESDMPDWTPENPDVHRSDRALRVAINVQYAHQAEQWYQLYQEKAPGDAAAGAPGVPAE